jgi:hypothetical protein
VGHSIKTFGGDGEHEVRFRTEAGQKAVWVRRDLWFDRDDSGKWVVWAQQRPRSEDGPLQEGDVEAQTLGSIVVTNPVVIEFLEQLGELLVNPVAFRHEPHFDGVQGDVDPPGH